MKLTRAIGIVGGLVAAVATPGCKDSVSPLTITVTSVSPATGSLAGGTGVTIAGTNFVNVTSVTIGGSELGNRTVVSATEITGTTPAATSSGTKDVVVTSSSQGSSTCSGCFTYEAGAVTVTAVSPPSGRVAGGTSVTITGTNFVNVTSVTIGGNELGSRTMVSPTQITGTTPAATSPGRKDVVVTSSSQGSSTCSGCFGYESGNVVAAAIAAGAYHICGLTSAGAAYCWGYNGEGQFGDGSTTNSPTPVAVAGGLSFSALGAGSDHTCALTTSGAAYCWGRGYEGQLGDGSTTGSLTPVAVVGDHTFIALSLGGDRGHTCGLTSVGTAYCWGYNGSGQLGDGSTSNSAIPVAVVGGHNFVALTAAGGLLSSPSHTCGLTSNGAAYCWGDNYTGQLGDGSTTNSPTPVAVAGGLSFSALGAGFDHTCGLTQSGTAYCWGYNQVGSLGDGSTTSSTTPVAVAGGLTFSALALGELHTCGLTSSGAAFCWGFNYYGQLGNGPGGGPDSCFHVFWEDGFLFPCSTKPVAVGGGLSFNALTLGGFHTCARTSAEAAVYCWGDNARGQLGDGQNWLAPAPVVGDLSFSALDASMDHTCGLTSAGAAYCWGRNDVGQLGNGGGGPDSCWSSRYDSYRPCSATPVAAVGGHNFIAVGTGGSTETGHTCGLTGAGAAYCWGYNGVGQLGDGSTTNTTTPVAVIGDLSFSALGMGAGYNHTCALTTSGAAYCWGRGYEGQLGDGSTTSSATPVAVAGGLSFSALATGQYHTCGLTSGGAAYCWGEEYDPTQYRRYGVTPVAVPGGLSFSALAVGFDHNCALTSGGSAYCWGRGYGWTPVAVPGGLSFSILAAAEGGTGTCGLTSSGAAYCWDGPYGPGAPVPVAEGWSFRALALSYFHTCGLTSSGAAYCWGRRNHDGQLGRGVFDYSPVPVAVAPFSASARASAVLLPAGSMRVSKPFFGERCTPPGPARQPSAERRQRDPWCGARP